MPILKFTASADTTITNAYKPGTLNRAYYANLGAADSLELYSIYNSGTVPQKSRILIQFPINDISQSRTNGSIPASGNVNFIFNLYNVTHPETLPTNYYAIVTPISSAWDEGYGLDLENLTDIGQSGSKGIGSNWIQRSTTSGDGLWVTSGGDFITGSYAKTVFFDNGIENISLDITKIVEDQISGVIPNYGLAVYLSGGYEDGTFEKTYYTKRFSSRSSEYFYKVPTIQARWESTVKDDRGQFFYASDNLSDTDNQQSLFFYNRFNGALKDLKNNTIPYVKVYNSSGSLLATNLISSRVSTGTYKVTFSITGSVEDTFSDVWFSGSSEFYTGSFDISKREFDDSFSIKEYVLSSTNIKNTYSFFEKPVIKIFAREKNWNPNIYSIAQKDITPTILKKLYYKVFRVIDNLDIIDYGISPTAYTLTSYDKNGNYLTLDMSMFEKGYSYGIKFMLLNEDIKIEFPEIFKFKVE
jgi:hypothetical protein